MSGMEWNGEYEQLHFLQRRQQPIIKKEDGMELNGKEDMRRLVTCNTASNADVLNGRIAVCIHRMRDRDKDKEKER